MTNQMDELIKTDPESALLRHRFSLTSEQLERCLGLAPEAALAFAQGLELTRRQIMRCCYLDPSAAGRSGFVDGLGNELLDYCISKEPGEVIKRSVSWLCTLELSEEQFSRCAIGAPDIALEFASSHMSPTMLRRCQRVSGYLKRELYE